MQQFKAKLKNTPTDTPLVCSSVNSVLNRLKRVSVQGKVLTLNNLEVDLLQHKGG
jgi:predicted ATPase